jgi:CxxC motif-containing protein (DUF1111 family)
MKFLKLSLIILTVIAIATAFETRKPVQSQTRPESKVDQMRRDRFRHNGVIDDEGGSAAASKGRNVSTDITEAPTGFDNLTNGYIEQGPEFATIDEDNVVPLRSFNDDRFIFEEFENIDDGLGPTYNAQSCRECHQNVVTGGASQVTVQRTGRTENGAFFESLGGSLIHSRATYRDLVELVSDEDDTRTLRISPSTLGDGFVEAISNRTLLSIRNAQPSEMRGNAVSVPVLEGNGNARIGRFGWKCQHGSLVSFSLDAYLNEMGITTPLLPEENTSSGSYVGYGSEYDPVEDPEDEGIDPVAFADFMRATKAPPRGAINAAVLAGEQIFAHVGCNICHTPSIVTASAGSIINGGSFTVSPFLGDKTIHPYSDFLLHDIGTGDGVPILPTSQYSATASQMRTAPLWGLRTRSRLMHDGLSFTLKDAIVRHAGQALQSSHEYSTLTGRQKFQLIAFLRSL